MRAEMAAEPDLSGYDVALSVPRWRPWVFIGVGLLVAALVVGGAGFAAAVPVVGTVGAGLLALLGVLSLWRGLRLRQRLHDVLM